ncbi:sodium-dependent multivitamin transporter-like [Mizuhopecten yessoensis]|uniref:sodium-dependent multivitamin transporter-like n=1 Tax=Mizuhopecten yessoensis TaxID=6573 RepID=UPI000B45EC69|nr:sodium-dependent multivitamin transporter-like [Mizuhopecten yessoensis]XP_021354938.1 sodium-dependent multivitamin transporter-like [Mizuhopecten yessoensis]XP_021354939.1 sodium-dependent multivitamin transporter-like [Mizuhopecten yessoensis]XP_021354940.1 sodium-dependent multivitamin transporter-like [Mizuhopecten yessoensis]XP_021354941.1 sodium-dependent multivitamin transporter-like [Mizuhopecten yessoensis]
MAFLKWEDYVMFVITLVFSLGIGLFFSLRSNRLKTTKRFILGDGNMSSFPVALSLMVSFESGVMMLGVPAEVYMYGMQWYISIIASFFSYLLTTHLLIPSLKELKLTSINQYMELRYNSHGLRLFATIISLLSWANYLGTVLFVPAVTLEIVAGIPMWISIVSLTIVVVVYTIIGGFTAVIWTDVFQAFLMFGGMFAILIKGTMEAGGVANTWSIVREKGRFNMLDFNPDPTLRQSFWSLTIGGVFHGLRMQFNQATYQRVKATSTVSAAKRMYMIAAFLLLFISGLAVLEGAVMFAYYHSKGCDPLEVDQVRNQNQLIAKMVRDIFLDTPCLPGLFLAALFSASLSTMSSVLSAMSAVFWEDIIKPHTKPMSDKRAIRIAQLSVLFFGGISVCIAIGISGIDGPISRILDITGSCFDGAVGGLFILGWFVPRANARGGLVGGFVSVLFVGWISFGKLISSGVRVTAKLEPASTEKCPPLNISGIINATLYGQLSAGTMWNESYYKTDVTPTTIISEPDGLDTLYSLSYKWLTPLGIVLVLIVGSLVSRLQARTPVDPSLVVPICDYLCCCMPELFRRKFRCGVKYPPTVKNTDEAAAESAVEMLSPHDSSRLSSG